jgi:5-methyltetrahydrofolate--homocysteine methyltransferase
MKPKFIGVKEIEPDLSILREWIDWTFFFHTWELKGTYPNILKNETYGSEATRLFNEANHYLDLIIAQNSLKAKGVYAILPANSRGDDVVVYKDETRTEVIETFHFLRQQHSDGEFNLSLSDFIAPESKSIADWIGMFAVTSGIGCDELVLDYEKKLDDYSAIMVKALADRLAEAFAEYLHFLIRKQIWAYASDESLSNQEIIQEKYQGIRPAAGYPACPDHSEKAGIWKILEPDKRFNLILTESYAMHPGASVSGWYFAHPKAHYFGLGKIAEDQVIDYAKRKGWSKNEAEKWLAPALNY